METPLLPYLILFGIFAIGALAAGSRPHGEYRWPLLIGGLVLVVVIGLRYQVGGDWDTYLSIFHDIKSKDLWSAITSTSGSDPGYSLVNWIAAQAGLGIWAVNLVCAVIFTWGLLKLCRTQPNPPLAALVAIPYLVVVVAMGYTRQAAALGFIMYAITQIPTASFLKIGLSLLLAAMFHKSALIMFPFFAIAFGRGSVLKFLSIGLLGYLGFKLLLAGSTGELMKTYVGSGYSSSGALIRVLMNVAPAIIYLRFIRRFRFERRQQLFWVFVSLASLAALAGIAAISSSTVIDRLALFMIPLQVAVLSRTPSAFGSTDRQNMFLVVMVIVYSLAVELVWLDFGQFAHRWIPYRNYLWS